jgi:hypothetical protein
MPREITLVIAPTIPESERKRLEKRVLGLARSKEALITNYHVYLLSITIPEGNGILVLSAPDIPTSELMKLKKKIDDPKTKIVVINYDISVTKV